MFFSVMFFQQVVTAQNLIKLKGIVWGSLLPSPSSVHLAMSSLVIEVTTLDSLQIYNLAFPPKSTPHPSWLTDKIDIHVDATKTESFGNGSFTVFVASYQNLSQFLPARYLHKLR